MSWLVHARLVNGPFDDPGLFIDFRFGRRAILFDLGDLSALSARELLRVGHVFVSHAHVDHFFGFDLLLRVCLHREEPLCLLGPPGFIDRVGAKLDGYTWNLLDETSPDFAIVASEFERERVVRSASFRAREAFRRRDAIGPVTDSHIALAEDDFRIEARTLEHGTPCLAFALQETVRVNVWKEGLAALGLPVGSWLNQAKRAVRRGASDDQPIAVPGGTRPLGLLKERALRVAPGQRIVYVTDAAGNSANAERIVELARGADHLFIEAVFLDEDRELAERNHHLTAKAAGEIARRAGVARVTPFHFSARYLEREDAIRQELLQAIAGRGDELPVADGVLSKVERESRSWPSNPRRSRKPSSA
jgi:ribonuclease Z